MKTLNISQPDSVKLDEIEVKLAFTTKLDEISRLPFGLTATLAEHSIDDFMQFLADNDVVPINYLADKINDDLNNTELYIP